MLELKGLYSSAKIFTDKVDEKAMGQIQNLLNQEFVRGSKIRIMPDVHAGMGCTIGTTMTITDKIVPGMVGVDIGCGMETVRLAEREIDCGRLDRLIRREIPSGFDVRESHHPLNKELDLSALKIARLANLERARRSIGTLGGGNHFIEVGASYMAEPGALYLVVHSGSRHLGSEVANHYQEEAHRQLCGSSKKQAAEAIAAMKAGGRQKEIASAVRNMKQRTKTNIPKALAYVSGELFCDYIHDMKLVQRFAALNRIAMTEIILEGMGLAAAERFTTVHNYIDTDRMLLRKGAVSAAKGEKLLVPINMRDGSLICIGKGNPDWNESAPHGAGRLMSRTEAMKKLSLERFQNEMKGVFTTSVSRKTLDEAPMAYKSAEAIERHIAPAAEIVERVRPIYNFKASE